MMLNMTTYALKMIYDDIDQTIFTNTQKHTHTHRHILNHVKNTDKVIPITLYRRTKQ